MVHKASADIIGQQMIYVKTWQEISAERGFHQYLANKLLTLYFLKVIEWNINV